MILSYVLRILYIAVELRTFCGNTHIEMWWFLIDLLIKEDCSEAVTSQLYGFS